MATDWKLNSAMVNGPTPERCGKDVLERDGGNRRGIGSRDFNEKDMDGGGEIVYICHRVGMGLFISAKAFGDAS